MSDQLPRSIQHRGEVIEIYENGRLKAAVKFYCNIKRGERIEIIDHNVPSPDGARVEFYVGQKGVIHYVCSLNGHYWVFEAKVFKD